MLNIEHPAVKKALSENPSLFKKPPFIEGADELSRFGIFIPGKDSFPLGFLKLYPEDFIVEEIDATGALRTIDEENVLASDQAIPGEGDTIFATLVKCGMSTIEATHDIAKRIGIDPKGIGYAGIKDKNAITAQRISIRGGDENALKAIDSPHYFLKDAERGKGSIGMTNLLGNRFSIFVRTAPGANVPSIESDEESFYNYFYLQRFGSPRFINYEWGYAILKGRYEDAVKSVLFDVAPREIGFIAEIRKAAAEASQSGAGWESIKAVFDPILDILRCERTILEHLIAHPTDHKGALNRIPDQVQLWLYGLASLLWNEKVSAAIQKGSDLPPEIPFIFSDRREDIELYRDELKALGIFPPPFENLRPFPYIRLAHRTAKPTEKALFVRTSDVPGGFIATFSLSKGGYATTYLSHLINIVGDSVPEGISNDRVDVASFAGNRRRTIERFLPLGERPNADGE